MDRFNTADLQHWQELSRSLDQLNDELHFGTEPQRRRLRPRLVDALKGVGAIPLVMDRWVRVVTYQYSLEPLTAAGSLQAEGQRFNAGFELDTSSLAPWPALYLAQNYETAFREKFQLSCDESTEGLSPQELALEQDVSHTTVFVKGRIERVFDMTTFLGLNSLAKVLREIKMPHEALALRKKLKIATKDLFMIQTGMQLFDAVVKQNWRVLPVQFGLPAPSQTIADLIREAGYEAILYQSTKGPGRCLAVFPDRLSDNSYVELIDKPPSASTHTRLDIGSASELEGWESIPRKFR